VVASLWNVRDDPTSRIMIRFYECLSKPGTSRLAALTQAQREYLANQLRELESERPPDVLVGRGKVVIAKPDPLAKDSSPPFPAPDNHPFYWAAFELIGDWR
jgi:CHAT domain-containing protein